MENGKLCVPFYGCCIFFFISHHDFEKKVKHSIDKYLCSIYSVKDTQIKYNVIRRVSFLPKHKMTEKKMKLQ